MDEEFLARSGRLGWAQRTRQRISAIVKTLFLLVCGKEISARRDRAR